MERIKCSDNLCEESSTESCVCQNDVKLCFKHLEEHKKLCEVKNGSPTEEQKTIKEEDRKVHNERNLVIGLEEISQSNDPEAIFRDLFNMGYDAFRIMDIEVCKITNDRKYLFICIKNLGIGY